MHPAEKKVGWNKKKAASLIGYLKEELHLDRARISVRKLAKSAGIIVTSCDLNEIEENLFLQGLIATEETATLVKSILLEEGYRANGSIEAFQLRRRGKWRR